jgi:pyruvate formate lyase activating enzyme
MEALSGTAPSRYWRKLDPGRVECRLCPRFCKLHEGQRGFCFVRACQNGEIVLTSYGRSSGFWVDPIEKKPLHHFLPGTPVLSFGTAGCNLGCQFCQNWEISRSREIDTSAEEASPETRCIALQNGIRYAYCGNQVHEQESNTYCHRCHRELIGRDRYRVRGWNLSQEGRCLSCGARCAGVFADLPGSWGPRSMPVRLAYEV